jgi:uncharacterized repeat protein (TIGR03803 family)
MTKLSAWKMACLVFLLCAATTIFGHAQIFQTLADFDGANGAGPYVMSLVQGTDGDFYGTTYQGSAYESGVVFKVTPGGTRTTLHLFCSQPNCPDGKFPYVGLLLAADGNLYGTTNVGGIFLCGCGTIFKFSPGHQFTTVYSFHGGLDGSEPFAPLIQAADGSFYGTTDGGGAYGYGTIFKISTSGVLNTLHSFSCRYCGPGGALVQGQDGNFYGTAGGGPNGVGTIFEITPNGSFNTLYTFCSQPKCIDGVGPQGLLLASDGNFYGTTVDGGANNCGPAQFVGCGTVFKVTPNGELTTLYTFCAQPNCADGATPWAGLIQATDGALYGTTSEGGNPCMPRPALHPWELRLQGCGTIFRITLAGSLTTLHSFDLAADGFNPVGGLLQATNGNFYGTTELGGNAGDYGTVFSLDMGLGPFVAFVRGSGEVGQTGGILGQGFTGTTSVSLNGIPASFTVVSDTFIKATVPPGATTGFVTVVTPTGMLTSNVPFRVLQ